MYFFQNSPAPGREGSPKAPATPAPAPAEGATSEGAPASAEEPPSIFNGGMLLVFALPLLLVILMTRSQNKKQKAIESNLKVGDKVISKAGLLGKLVEVGDRTARLEIAPGVVIQILKTAIEGIDAPPKSDKEKESDKSDKEKDKSDSDSPKSKKSEKDDADKGSKSDKDKVKKAS